MRGKLFAAVAGALAGALAVLLARSRPLDPPAARPAPLPMTAAEVALDRPLADVALDATPFDAAIPIVERQAGVPITVDWRSLEAAGVGRTVPVTLRARGMTLAEALGRVLDQASTPTAKLGFEPETGTVFVSTGEALAARPVLRVYDVRDLVAAAAPDAKPAGPSGGCLMGVGGSPGDDAAENLVRLIGDTIVPDSWRDAGGSVGAIRYFGGRLTIVQTRDNHRRVRDLLALLRETPPPAAPPGPAPEVFVWRADAGGWVSTDSDAADRALRRTIGPVRLDGVSFEGAVERLRKESAVPLVVDAAALDEAGFDRHGATVTADLHDVTLARALRIVLSALRSRADGADFRAAFAPDGGLVLLTTAGRANERPIARAYDLRDWPRSDPWPRRAAGVRAADAAERNAPPAGGERVVLGRNDEAMEELARALPEAVAPDSWREAGGLPGSVRVLNGFLIVSQTWENHEDVRRFLNAVRAGDARPPGGGAAARPTARPATASGAGG